MDCTQAQQLLSAYFDDELPSDSRQDVATHLASCRICSMHLDDFTTLSRTAKQLTHPLPLAVDWREVEPLLVQQSVDDESDRTPMIQWLFRRKSAIRYCLTAAAGIMLLTAVAVQMRRADQQHDHHLAAFERYLVDYGRDSAAAQRGLLSSFRNTRVTPDEAMHLVGYRPTASLGLPDGYELRDTHAIEMPCCTCIHCVCVRADGSTFAIIEHPVHDHDWFGQRKPNVTKCSGKQCNLYEFGTHLAVAWEHGNRHMTLVGARDQAEIETLIAWFGHSSESRQEDNSIDL